MNTSWDSWFTGKKGKCNIVKHTRAHFFSHFWFFNPSHVVFLKKSENFFFSRKNHFYTVHFLEKVEIDWDLIGTSNESVDTFIPYETLTAFLFLTHVSSDYSHYITQHPSPHMKKFAFFTSVLKNNTFSLRYTICVKR